MLWHGEVPVGARARTGLGKLICGELIRAYYEVTNVSITGDLSKAHLQYDVCMRNCTNHKTDCAFAVSALTSLSALRS